MTKRLPLREVVATRAGARQSVRGRTATIRFATTLTLECGHEVRESGCSIPVQPPERFTPQKCRECKRQ